MDLREFSEKLAAATRDMSPQERDALRRAFLRINDQLQKEETGRRSESPAYKGTPSGSAGYINASHGDQVPDGPTPRILALKKQYMTHKPTITLHRAKAITKVYEENPGMPPILLRGMAFKRCCEEAPLVIQPGELIVGNPTGAPRHLLEMAAG